MGNPTEMEQYPPLHSENYTKVEVSAGMCYQSHSDRKIWIITDIGEPGFNDIYAGHITNVDGVLEITPSGTVKPHREKIILLKNNPLNVETVIRGFENWYMRVEGNNRAFERYINAFRRAFSKGSKNIYITKK